jgi:hypothetical protein
MDYFIGISPPDEYKMKIMKFLQHWGLIISNHIFYRGEIIGTMFATKFVQNLVALFMYG